MYKESIQNVSLMKESNGFGPMMTLPDSFVNNMSNTPVGYNRNLHKQQANPMTAMFQNMMASMMGQMSQMQQSSMFAVPNNNAMVPTFDPNFGTNFETNFESNLETPENHDFPKSVACRSKKAKRNYQLTQESGSDESDIEDYIFTPKKKATKSFASTITPVAAAKQKSNIEEDDADSDGSKTILFADDKDLSQLSQVSDSEM